MLVNNKCSLKVRYIYPNISFTIIHILGFYGDFVDTNSWTAFNMTSDIWNIENPRKIPTNPPMLDQRLINPKSRMFLISRYWSLRYWKLSCKFPRSRISTLLVTENSSHGGLSLFRIRPAFLVLEYRFEIFNWLVVTHSVTFLEVLPKYVFEFWTWNLGGNHVKINPV